MKLLFRLFLLALFCVPVIIPMMALQRDPLVQPSEGQLFNDIDETKKVLRRFDPRMMDAASRTTVTVTDGEISRAIGTALSSFSRASARVEALTDGVWIGWTIKLPIPDTFIGQYLNVQGVVEESDSELSVRRLSVGALPIPAWLVKPVTIYALDRLMGDGKGEPTYASVRSLSVSGDRIAVVFQPPANLVADMRAAAGRAVHLGNAESVRAYYEAVTQISKGHLKTPVSLSFYMSPLFTKALERSKTRDPVDENRALILALALYFGDSRFELLLRDVNASDFSDGDFDTDQVHLEKRHDWVQHFTTAAAIQVAAGSGISNFIGEAKEISDTDGPSGFSFADIAADRTGVRFAAVATASSASARQLQEKLSKGVSEGDFFPLISDLPEGLTEAEFKETFGDIDTEKYESMILRIDRRVEDIGLYKASSDAR